MGNITGLDLNACLGRSQPSADICVPISVPIGRDAAFSSHLNPPQEPSTRGPDSQFVLYRARTFILLRANISNNRPAIFTYDAARSKIR